MKQKTLNFQNCLGVFQGGGCRGAAFVGAFTEATDRGVSFSEVVGTSAGSIVAALIAAGATPEKLVEIIQRLNFTQLLSDPVEIKGFKSSKWTPITKFYSKEAYSVVKYAGMYNSSKLKNWIDEELKKLLNKKGSVKFKDLIIPTTIVVTDLKSRTYKLYGNLENENENVADAVRNSCNMPLFFQPIDNRYVDGGMLSNLPSFVFKNQQDSTYEKVLAFTLASEIESDNTFTDIRSYLELLSTTSIEGAINIQMALQKNVHIITIPTGKIQATDFRTITKENVNTLIEQGKAATSDFFNDEIPNIRSNNIRSDVYQDPVKAYNDITNASSYKIDEIIIAEYDTKWVWELFPSIVSWLINNARIIVLIKKNNDDQKHGPDRKMFLKNIGCEIIELEEMPMRGIIINGNDTNRALALVFNEFTEETNTYHSKSYYGEEDSKVISLLRYCCIKNSTRSHKAIRLSAQPIVNDLFFTKLKKVKQYSLDSVTFTLENIDVDNVIFITRFVQGYKYRQIGNLFKLFKDNNIDTFVPAQLVLLDGTTSMIAPAVIERHGDSLYVIEGNTRLTFAKKNGVKSIKAIVVNGVQEALPSSGRYRAHEMLISDRETKGDKRYNDWKYNFFRKIESAVRNSSPAI